MVVMKGTKMYQSIMKKQLNYTLIFNLPSRRAQTDL